MVASAHRSLLPHSMKGHPVTDPTVRCERCERPYPAELPGCPNCRRIRQTNIAIATTMILLVLFAIGGWFGIQVFTGFSTGGTP
ncbi:hypothetical protein [Azospirillum argentinense]